MSKVRWMRAEKKRCRKNMGSERELDGCVFRVVYGI